MDTLTTDPFRTSPPTTYSATPSAISSPASAAGPRLCDDPEFGRIIARFGLEAVLASLSPSRASKAGLPTSGTCGPSGDTSSRSAALQQSLENRLRPLLNGSSLCEVIWKSWTTPWGQCLSRPRARVRSICETDTGLWQTMVADDAMDRDGGKVNSRGEPKLSGQALWATAAARDWRSDRSQKTSEEMYGSKGRPLARQAIEAVWPTPTSLAPAKHGNNEAGNSAGLVAIRKHALAATTISSWPTPQARDHFPPHTQEYIAAKKALGHGMSNLNDLLGSSEPTEKRGSLNPLFVAWLMGYGVDWMACAPVLPTKQQKK